jgi:hypothetical protein
MMNDVVVVRLRMNSWLDVVVVVKCVVDELMHGVSWISELVMRIVVVVESCGNLMNWWILLCWCFNLKTYACLSVLKCIWPINIFGIKFWGLEWSKLGFWGENGWNS